ncbi:MAG: hypothetical protein ACJ77E_00875 [Gaiellaceae bacterium]
MLFSTRYDAIPSGECQCHVVDPAGKFASGRFVSCETSSPFPIAVLPSATVS